MLRWPGRQRSTEFMKFRTEQVAGLGGAAVLGLRLSSSSTPVRISSITMQLTHVYSLIMCHWVDLPLSKEENHSEFSVFGESILEDDGRPHSGKNCDFGVRRPRFDSLLTTQL